MKPEIGDIIFTQKDYGVVINLCGEYNNNIVYYSFKDNEETTIFFISVKKIIKRQSNEVLEDILKSID